jgi:hypothetical protein
VAGRPSARDISDKASTFDTRARSNCSGPFPDVSLTAADADGSDARSRPGAFDVAGSVGLIGEPKLEARSRLL